jgi:hypothetical protein
MQKLERKTPYHRRPSRKVIVACCLALLTGGTQASARTPPAIDQLDLRVHPADVTPPPPPLDAQLPPVPEAAPGADDPPDPVEEVDKVAPRPIPNRQLGQTTRLGEFAGQEGGVLQDFLERKTIPLFRVNAPF